MDIKAFFTVLEAAKILHISRIAVFKRIKNGQLKAQKIGRNYAIAREDLEAAVGATLTEAQQKEIEEIVKKAVEKYSETFRRLGKE